MGLKLKSINFMWPRLPRILSFTLNLLYDLKYIKINLCFCRLYKSKRLCSSFNVCWLQQNSPNILLPIRLNVYHQTNINQNYSTEIYSSKIVNLNNSTQDVTGTFMHQYFNLFDVVKDLRGFQIDILKKP